MSTVWDDLRYAFRMLRKSVGFTSVAILTLALGIGANAVIFSVIDAALLKPLPFPNPKQLVLVWETDVNRKIFSGTTPPGDFFDWRAQNNVFQSLSAFQTWWFDLTGSGEAEQVWGANVTANFLDTLEVKPELGRSFTPNEEKPGNNDVVMISHRIWVTRYGSDPHIIGKNIILDYQPCTVVGVLPPGFNFLGTTTMYDILRPLAFAPADIRRDNASLIGLARLKPGVSIAQADADMKTIENRLANEYTDDRNTGARVASMHEDLTSSMGEPLWILLAAVGLVLLIACANVANLILSRSAGRQREVAIRAALGARRWRLARQLLTESVALSFIGGAAGLAFAYAALHVLPAILPAAGGFGELHNGSAIGINVPVLIFTFVVTILTGIIFGLAPAFQFSRVELNDSLKESVRGSAGVQSRFTRNLLVVTEIGLSVILLIGAATLIRAFHGLMNQDPGFNPHDVLSMQVLLKNSQYHPPEKVRAFFDQTLERMRALPGVQSASAIDYLPLTGYTDFAPLEIAGRAAPPPGEEYVANYRVVDTAYFHTLQIPLLAGRSFGSQDTANGAPVVLISASFAKKYWPNQNPIGERVRTHLAGSNSPWRPILKDEWRTIVGIVGDDRERWDGDRYDSDLYFPFEQAPSRIMRIVLRTSGNPSSLAPAARQVVASIDKNQPITFMRTMDDLQASTVSSQALEKTLLTIFAALALVLASIGIYGVISYGVEQRTHEIGIRMALGAQKRDVVGLVIRQGLRLIVLGLAIGIVGAFIATRLLAGFFFGASSFDAPASIVAILVLAAAGLLACYIPARRAAQISPMQSLRHE